MGVTFAEGVVLQCDRIFLTPGTLSDTLGFALSADSVPWTGSETYGDQSVWLGGRGPLAYSEPYPLTIEESAGVATITMAPVDVELTAGSTTVTLYQWLLYSSSDSVLLWGGELSPPLTIQTGGTTFAEIFGITITLGECVSPASPTLLLSDTFGGVGSSPLGSDTPQVGGPWTVLSGSIVAGGGQCSPTAGSGSSWAATPQGGDALTLTLPFSAGSGSLTEGVGVVVYGSSSTTYLRSQLFGGTVSLYWGVGGSDTQSADLSVSVVPGDSYTLGLVWADPYAIGLWEGQAVTTLGPLPLGSADSVGLVFLGLVGAPNSIVTSINVTTP